jgi:hypothetical protein
MRRRLAPALLLAAVLWLGAGFAREAVAAWRARSAPPRGGDLVFWRLGDAGPERLARFLAAVAAAVPPGAVVVVTDPGADANQRFFLRLWAAYFLPRHRVLGIDHPEAARAAEYLVSYGAPMTLPRLAPALYRPEGVLYRVRPWTASP